MYINFIKHFRPFIILLMLLVLWIWASSFFSLPKEASPWINVPFFTITTVYPWADPETITTQIIEKFENEFQSIAWVSSLESISAYNVWVVSVEFERTKNSTEAYSELQSAIDKVKWDFSPSVKMPVLKKTDTTDSPILTFSVWGQYLPWALYNKVSFLENELLKIKWVSDVIIIWEITNEIKIKFDYEKLLLLKINYSQAINTISTYIDKFPAWKKDINESLYTLSLRTYPKDLEKTRDFLKDIALINIDWKSLNLSEVAQIIIEPTYAKKNSYIDDKIDSYNTVTYQIKKVPWSDILQIIDEIHEVLEKQNDYFTQSNLKIFEVDSQKESIDSTYKTFVWNFWQTSLIIFIIIFLSIWFKESIAISIVFPLVYFASFIYLTFIWYTFNNIVSFSLVLTLWIMVDNLVIISEWFEEWLNKWYDKYKAINYSVSTYWKALLSWNFTTISMFIPIWFMLSGKIGDFMKYMPTTVDSVLIFSMIASLLFLPIIFSLMNFKPREAKEKHFLFDKLKGFFTFTIKHFKLTLLFFLFLTVFTWFLTKIFIKVDFLPPVDTNNIYINLQFDKNTSLEENKQISAKITKDINNYFSKKPWVLDFTSLNIWDYKTTDPLLWVVYRNSFAPEVSYLNLRLNNTKQRPKWNISYNLAWDLKEYLSKKDFWAKLISMESFIQKSWPSKWKDINFLIEWNNLEDLWKFYTQILWEIQKIPWTYDWASSLEYTNWKLEIIWDVNKLKQFNISSQEVDLLLTSLQFTDNYEPNGIIIEKLDDFGWDLLDVKWYIVFDDKSKEALLNTRIPWRDIYLSDIIKETKILPEVKSISHNEWKMIINIWAYKTKEASLWAITPKIDEILINNIKDYPQINYSYSWDVQDMQKSMTDLIKAFWLGILFMFWVLVLHFSSFKQALLILSVIPLLFVWAFLFLVIFGLPFSFPAQLWMFGLMWVWVNTAILLIERYNEIRNQNLDRIELLLDVVRSRLKPVLLTTTTTILGLVTLAITDEMWWSLAMAFMWGLIIWTLVILLYIPAVLSWGLYRKR
ncbi:MAG: Outer membrane efflux protein [uncultured bacterium (gcode 4)]|uniref:Outer membrane efflux protein n=1 Tax=uncultured bacterium (gcode 4) TaxID=1234023 RepID=K2AYF7_9BACT|nr:MAG: Outer membrane efflux protein [uncultured bacterium (gcode 4)]